MQREIKVRRREILSVDTDGDSIGDIEEAMDALRAGGATTATAIRITPSPLAGCYYRLIVENERD